jgi:hypothetical protein
MIKRYAFIFPIFLILISCNQQVTSNPSSAQYKLTFKSTWSNETHPTQFPNNAHFSGLIGATHKQGTKLWETGKVASDGIKSMAEIGSKTPLISEIDQLVSDQSAETLISGNGLAASPSETSITFTISRDFPYVTVVSMVAPSSDWFVGVSGLNLYENGEWVNKSIELKVYDAGTDSGPVFTAENANTQPPEPIQLLSSEKTDTDFINGMPSIGTFTFTKVSE